MIISPWTHNSWQFHHGKNWRLTGGLEALDAEYLGPWVQARDPVAEAYKRGYRAGQSSPLTPAGQ